MSESKTADQIIQENILVAENSILKNGNMELQQALRERVSKLESQLWFEIKQLYCQHAELRNQLHTLQQGDST